MPRRKVEEEDIPPLVDASTPGMYRDELFWLFNYPDEFERIQAMQEYEQYSLNMLLAEIESMPDVREE